MKTCTRCSKHKPLFDFYSTERMLDGRASRCKVCVREAARISYQNTPAEIRKASRNAWRVRNIDKARAYSTKSWRKNPGSMNANTARRRAMKKAATPAWLTKEQYREMRGFYVIAKELAWLSEERLEVDHIVPLVGENVCGLHVPWNLQILPKSVNVRKGNRMLK